MSNRKLNSAFAQLIQARNAGTNVSLEADPADPTTSNAPETTDEDALLNEAGDDTPAVDPAAPADAPAVATDTPPDAVVDPVVDPTDAVTDPAVDPVTDTVASASAGTPPADAAVGQGTEPTKIVIDVNVNSTPTPTEPAVAPAMAATGAVLASSLPPDTMVMVAPSGTSEDLLVNQNNEVQVVDPDAAVVVTDPVTGVTDDGVVSMNDETTSYVNSNILSEEELKTIDFHGDGAKEELQVVDAMTVKIVELEGEIGQYEAGHQSMKKMTEVLDTSKEEGGITDNAAQLLKIAVEHISEQLGLGSSVMLGIPSLEAFSLQSSRQSATSLALEDLKETAAKVWAAIQAGYQKVMEWLGNFFKHIFSANERLAAQATAIQAAVAKVQNATSNQKFDNPGIAKTLANGQAIATNVPGALSALNKFAAAAETGSPALFQQLSAALNKAKAIVTSDQSSDEDISSSAHEVVSIASNFINSLASAGGLKKDGRDPKTFGLSAPGELADLFTSNTWLGNKIVYAYVPNGSGKYDYRAGQAVADIGDISPTCTVLSAKDVTAVAGLVLDYTKTAQASKGVWDSMQEVYKTVMAGASLANSQAVLSGKKGYDKFKIFVEMAKNARAICSGIQQPAMAIAAAANGAALQYAAQSLKMLSAKLPAPAGTPPGAVPATEGIDDTLSIEGFIDDLKHPIEALKRKFSTSDEAVLAREIEAKRKILKKELQNLDDIKKAVSVSEAKESYSINLKKAQGHWNFSASTPAQLIAGLSKNAKFIETTAASFAKIKSKTEAQTILAKFKAEMEKIGSVPETMMFNKTQVLAYLEEAKRTLNAMESYFSAVEGLSKVTLSSEDFGDLGISLIRIIGGIVGAILFYLVSGYFLSMIHTAIFLANPFLGIGIGFLFFGIKIVGALKFGAEVSNAIKDEHDKKDKDSSSIKPAMA